MKAKYLLRNFFPKDTSINFLRAERFTLVASLFLIFATFWGLYKYSLNFGIDFTGGILFEIRLTESPDVAKIRKVINALEIGDVNVQTLDTDKDVMIRLGVKDEERREEYIASIKSALNSNFSDSVQFRKVEFIGAEVGKDMVEKGVISVIMTLLGILAYVWYRFNWQYSVGVVLGLVHDLILTIGFLAFSRFEFNTTSIAAILTILGYSVNDIVVIYDRIRENVRKIRKQPFDRILNTSINETLARTMLTGITTLIAVLALVLYAGESLRSFSITVFVGIIIGTYSSIFISVPILRILEKK